ncbi:hypothetical protein N7510_004189 [Penicillium lagena]|uniref:uncharacterized protein n=1 Tax=Penicillium lagena TaxID=94218 RepID=UPI0025409F70|nr:uncharacterized protein N7510_004189 [Penicillium lagena]KAJ5620205.1 hypothetical protein N7510_004189 [Penicillium lagena]
MAYGPAPLRALNQSLLRHQASQVCLSFGENSRRTRHLGLRGVAPSASGSRCQDSNPTQRPSREIKAVVETELCPKGMSGRPGARPS